MEKVVREATADTDAGIDAVSVFFGSSDWRRKHKLCGEMSETPDVSESPGKAGETEVTVRLEEPTEEATDTEEPDLDTEDPAESVQISRKTVGYRKRQSRRNRRSRRV